MTERARSERTEASDLPSVHAVILNWNDWERAAEAVRTTLGSAYPSLDVTLVDNGSTDGSEARLREAFPHLNILQTGRNLGFAGGINVGIHHAIEKGADFVWLLTNDLHPAPAALMRLVERAQADPRIGAVGGVIADGARPGKIHIWGGGWINLWSGFYGQHRAPVPARKIDYLTGGGLLLRGDALREVGLLDGRFFLYWEDVDISFRLRRAGWKLAVAPAAVVYHLAASESNRLARTRFSTISGIRFFLRYSPAPGIPLVIGQASRLLSRAIALNFSEAKEILRALWQEARGSVPPGRSAET